MLFRALSLTLAQLGDRRIVSVFAKSMLITIVICGLIAAGLAQGALLLIKPYMGSLADAGALVTVVAWLLAFALVMLAFRAIAIPVTGFFGDEVVAAIEDRHYPDQASAARAASFAVSLRLGLASLVRVLLINLAALPLYLVLLVTAVGPLVLFVAVNAVLLGRDLADMVAVRHLGPEDRHQWLRNHRIDYAVLGLIVTGLFLIPFVNLVAPLIGAGAATHLFHGRRL